MRDTSKRRERILGLLRKNGSVQVTGLSRTFRVSPQTIRQDLGFLVDLGVAARAYGGAMLREAPGAAAETTVELKRNLRSPEKRAIGRLAATLVRGGDSIVLDSGTTTLQVAVHLPKEIAVTVATNDLVIANELARHDNVALLMLGGSLRRKSMSLFGTQAEAAVRNLSFDKVFLGVDGFDLANGITTHFEPEAILNRLMCAAAREVVAVADSSKFGKTCLHRIVETRQITTLVTDHGASPAVVDALRALGIRVLLAPL